MLRVTLLAVLLLALPLSGCLDDITGSTSCDPYLGECRYELLQDDPYAKLLIEIDYVQGNVPDSEALDLLKQRIGEVTAKQAPVQVEQRGFDSNDDSYTMDEIRALEEHYRTYRKGDDRAVIHLLYLNGEFEENADTLGIAYTGTSIVMFKERIADAAFLLVSAQDIEKAVIVHEFGHLLGLVNIGYTSPHDHEDPDHPHHSNNDESVMYWAIESVDIGNQLDGEPPNDYDADDKDDLRLMRQGKL